MKKLLIGLLALGSLPAFASSLPFWTSYGDINTQVKGYNFQWEVDKRYPLGGGDLKITNICREILEEEIQMNPENPAIHGILLQSELGADSGMCLIKMDLNY